MNYISINCQGAQKLLMIASIMPITFMPLLTHATDKNAERPNVLFIPVDDLNPSLGCYGDKVVQTPNMDRLAKKGVRFTHAYAQYASCLPSRASLLSGWYPERTGIVDLTPKARDGVMKDVVYMGQHFRENNYFTVRLDKVFHIGADDPLSWDISEEPIRDQKPMWIGLELGACGLKDKVIKTGRYPSVEGEKGVYSILDCKDDDLFDGMKTNRAIELLTQLAKDKKPFFLACGYRRPHLPFMAPKKYFDMYPPEKMILPPPNPNDVERIPELDQREMIAHYYAATSYVDAQIGKLIEALEKLKLLDNTIIVLFGDNGYCFGEREKYFGKGNLWERSLKVPMIITIPHSMHAGTACDNPVGLIDMYPTLVELCGLPQPRSGLQGRSLVRLLSGDNKSWENYTISNYPLKSGKLSNSVRNERFRYTEDENGKPLELVDYLNDSYEWQNLVNDPKMYNVKKQLQTILHVNRK